MTKTGNCEGSDTERLFVRSLLEANVSSCEDLEACVAATRRALSTCKSRGGYVTNVLPGVFPSDDFSYYTAKYMDDLWKILQWIS
jgi:hypothetical protein